MKVKIGEIFYRSLVNAISKFHRHLLSGQHVFVREQSMIFYGFVAELFHELARESELALEEDHLTLLDVFACRGQHRLNSLTLLVLCPFLLCPEEFEATVVDF